MARPTDKGLITKSKLTAIGAALRRLFGGTKQYTPDEMAAAINGIEKKSSSDLVVSGGIVTAPAGYYEAPAMGFAESGTVQAPIVERRGISNATITLRAKVTVKEGYVSGGNIVGPYEYVSASELVSGTLSITSNGTRDVTKYASVNVNVPQPIEWDTWVFKDNIVGYLDLPDIAAFCIPALLLDGRLVTGIDTYYYDTGSTDNGYMRYYIGGSASATEVYTYADYGSTNTWVSNTYKTIKVPSYVRLFASVTPPYTGSPPYMYKRLYEFLSGAATRQT